MIKIFGLPSHQSKQRTSGVDFARIIQPLEAINRYSKEFESYVWKFEDKKQWDQIAKEFDIIYTSYTTQDWGFAMMGLQIRKNKKLLVMDIDDNLWNIQEDNAVYDTFKKGSDGIRIVTATLNEVDFITTTNSYLKNVITHNTYRKHEDIFVLPNLVDLDFYTYRGKVRKTDVVNMLYFGSTTHFHDLESQEFNKAVDKIMSDFPQVTFTTVGAFMPHMRHRWGPRYIQEFGSPDLYKWVKERYPDVVSRADFFIVPLNDTVYNRCKSEIKYLEMSASKIPGCYSDIRQYKEVIKDGINGFLCKTQDEWYNAMKKLIEDDQLRWRMGENAYNTIVLEHQIKDKIKLYEDTFRKMLDNMK